MEEKERYELLNDSFIYDHKLKEYVGSPSASMKHYAGTLTDLLNQQDKRIKELEEKAVYLKNYIREEWKTQKYLLDNNRQLAASELRKLKTELVNEVSPVNLSYTDYVQQVHAKIDNQIRKLEEN